MTEEADAGRATSERRRYNRRRADEVSPPYYEAFERMAVALEGIRQELSRRQVVLPGDAPAGPPQSRSPVAGG